jgi:hypothetical protein
MPFEAARARTAFVSTWPAEDASQMGDGRSTTRSTTCLPSDRLDESFAHPGVGVTIWPARRIGADRVEVVRRGEGASWPVVVIEQLDGPPEMSAPSSASMRARRVRRTPVPGCGSFDHSLQAARSIEAANLDGPTAGEGGPLDGPAVRPETCGAPGQLGGPPQGQIHSDRPDHPSGVVQWLVQ